MELRVGYLASMARQLIVHGSGLPNCFMLSYVEYVIQRRYMFMQELGGCQKVMELSKTKLIVVQCFFEEQDTVVKMLWILQTSNLHWKGTSAQDFAEPFIPQRTWSSVLDWTDLYKVCYKKILYNSSLHSFQNYVSTIKAAKIPL